MTAEPSPATSTIKARKTFTAEAFARLAGTEIGTSRWHVVEQDDANRFAVTTHDEQWIHTDPDRAALGPFGRTIAHGYLTLSLATALIDDIFEVSDAAFVVNYGVDRVRFPAPLPVGAAVRAQVVLTKVTEVPNGIQAHLHLVYEVRGSKKPCCVAEVLLRYYLGGVL